MNKLIGLSVLVLGCLLVSGRAEAASSVRGAKPSVAINYTSALIGVSSNTAVLYQVVLATGASTEYVAFFDSNSIVGLTGVGTTALKTRCYFGSTTTNSTCTFDPPLQFNNGIIAADSAATGQSVVSFERGRIPGL